MIKKFIIGFIVFILSQASFATNTEKFISLADIHFDPFTSCQYLTIHTCPIIEKLQNSPPEEWESIFKEYEHQKIASYGSDTNYALLSITLKELQQISKKDRPQFTLILGDFLAHNFHEKYVLYAKDFKKKDFRTFVSKTLQFLTLQLTKAIPQGDIYPVVGNNDSYTGDYNVVSDGKFLHETATNWKAFIRTPFNQNSFMQTFPRDGYYAVDIPHSKLRVLLLNTVLFSTYSQGSGVDHAQQQMQWLQNQLAQAKKLHKPVLLAFHIPMGIDAYATVKNLFGRVQEFWKKDYTNEFNKILQQYPDVVTGIFPAHIHRNELEWITLSNQDLKVPVTITQSVSPIFGNNPGFRVYQYDQTSFAITQVKVYFYSLARFSTEPHWQTTTF